MTQTKVGFRPNLTPKNIRGFIAMLADVYTANGYKRVALMVYGGGALLLASNFRKTTNDIDCFINNGLDLPVRENHAMQTEAMNLALLAKSAVGDDSPGKGWVDSSIYMVFEHSPLKVGSKENHIYLETITAEKPVFDIWVPDKELMLAMKVNAMRIDKRDDGKEPKDLDDLLCLLTLHPEIKNDEELIKFAAKFFPRVETREDVITGARRLFSDEFRDRPKCAQPFYSGGSRFES